MYNKSNEQTHKLLIDLEISKYDIIKEISIKENVSIRQVINRLIYDGLERYERN